jgi:hypothetical protein
MRFRTQVRNRAVYGVAALAMFMMCSTLLSMRIGAQDEGAGGWRITRAQYGWRDRQTDVTDLLQDLIARGGVNGRSGGKQSDHGRRSRDIPGQNAANCRAQ